MEAEIQKLIAKLEAQRWEAMDLLLTLSDDQLGLPYNPGNLQGEQEDGPMPMTIRRLVHRITTHHKDHIQHLLKMRRNMGKPVDEVTRSLIEMQEARTELISSLIGLTDEDLHIDVSAGNELGHLEPLAGQEPEYTIKRIVEHVVDMEERRVVQIRQALEGGAAAVRPAHHLRDP